MPTYQPITGATPDLAGTAAGIDPAYFTYPKTLFKSVPETPGSGGDVSAMTQIILTPPPPLEQNAAWQEVNRQLNANVKINMVANSDYQTKLSTTMAGSDFPDLLYFPSTLTLPDIPRFLQANYTDLTPYLSGDAAKDYPNLAAIPTIAWKQTVQSGGIYGIAIPRPFVQTIWYYNLDRLNAVGAEQPKNADDFKRILMGLTRPQEDQWGIAGSPGGPNALGVTGTPQLCMFGVPNNWQVDANGKFTKDYETDQFRTATAFVRDLYASGVYDPRSATSTGTTNKQGLESGRLGVYADGWFSYGIEYWDIGMAQTPPIRIRTFHPFSFDGGKPIWHQYQAYFGMTAIKKSNPERVKELLRIMNYLAAPFGSQESLLLEYGVKDVDFTYDARDNPVLTRQGKADITVSWRYLTMRPQVLFDTNDSDFAKTAYADEQTIIPVEIPDPSLGLNSATNLAKGGPLTQAMLDGLTDIVAARRPLSDLDQLVQGWRSGGGDRIRQEFQEAYAASH
jgi:putative aldouronate transport system substrate-binding protein